MQFVVPWIREHNPVAILTVVRAYNDSFTLWWFDLKVLKYLIINIIVTFLSQSLIDPIKNDFFVFECLQQELDLIVFFQMSEDNHLKVDV